MQRNSPLDPRHPALGLQDGPRLWQSTQASRELLCSPAAPPSSTDTLAPTESLIQRAFAAQLPRVSDCGEGTRRSQDQLRTLMCARPPCSRVPPGGRPVCALEDALDSDDHTTAPQRPAHKRPVQSKESGGWMTGARLLSLKRRGIRLGNRPTPALRVGSAPSAVCLQRGHRSVWFPEQVAMTSCDGSSQQDPGNPPSTLHEKDGHVPSS
ncbi:hypothetical protein MJT46_006407 [Ovis ammon polii x Ovis aries]|nr:hypothetical protein MJT46_006407 [Ovis ammon polii x Ovis aries]